MYNKIHLLYYFSLVVFLLLIDVSVLAQTQLSYFDGFETSADNQHWTLNHGPNGVNMTNKWYISDFEPYMGDSSLIISNNNGASAAFSNTKNTVVAFREYVLPPGTYNLSFMWRCVGLANNHGFYVCWSPSTTDIKSSFGGFTNANQALAFGGNKMLNLSSSWTNQTTTVVVQGAGTAPRTYRLYFVWDNNANAQTPPPAACIDNVQIAPITCTPPTNIKNTVTNNDITLSWSGSAISYDVMYSAYGSNTFTILTDITANSVILRSMAQGVYDFWVRSICGSDTSMWTVKQNLLIYNTGTNCIDFIDLDGPNALCQTGSFSSPNSRTGKVDNGASNPSSRHTVNFIPGVMDPWSTDGQLSTIPPGEIVSVRLGNPNSNSEQESVTYTYNVAPNENIILMLNYAVVFEEPGHAEENKFQVELLDVNGNLLEPKDENGLPIIGASRECSMTEFFAKNDPTWHKSKSSYSSGDCSWKDWTKVGINLTPFRGQTINVRISTFDCGWSGHYTYAYFSISCAKAEMSGYSCGDETDFSVSAPDGFHYKWYKPDAPGVILSTNKNWSVPSQQADTFFCDVISTENENCYFTLPAYLVPTTPLSRFTPKWVPENCENKILLENTGGILRDGRLTKDKCEYTEWIITDKSTGLTDTITDQYSPLLDVPDAGAEFDVRLVSGISHNQCTDTILQKVKVPKIGVVDTTIVAQTCKGVPYWLGGKKYDKTGIYRNDDDNVSVAGCDSFVVLDLTVIDNIECEIFDTICQGESYDLNGQLYGRTGDYMATIKSVSGCDSVVNLHLFVVPSVDVSFRPLSSICADDTMFVALFEYDDTKGKILNYSLSFDDKALDNGFEDVSHEELPTDGELRIAMPTTIVGDEIEEMPIPDFYTVKVIFSREKCDELTFDLPFAVYYPVKGIMEQKWNNVIALLNADYNFYGFEYSMYQWYKNGSPIEGATGPNLYIGDGVDFDFTAEYRVYLIREGESVGIMSCPLIPQDRTPMQVSEYDYLDVSAMGVMQRVQLKNVSKPGTAYWYSVSGQLVSSYAIDDNDPYIIAPIQSGIYILRLEFESEISNYKISIK